MPTVSKARLRELLAKETAHDDYRGAAREVRRRRAALELNRRAGKVTDDQVAGYDLALKDWAEAVVDVANGRPATSGRTEAA